MISLTQSGLLMAVLTVVWADCPASWKEWNGHCYLATARYFRWHGVRGECKKRYRDADAVTIKSKAEQDFVKNNVVGRRHVWLGMRVHNANSWWVDRSPVTYSNFGQQTPGAYDAVMLDGSTGLWSKVSSYSGKQRYAVCKMTACGCPAGWKLQRGRCFRAEARTLPWVEARQMCQKMAPAADLATTTDSDLNSLVFSMAAGKYPVWISLNDRVQEGKPVWGSTLPLSYSKWHPGEPNGHKHAEDCVAMLQNQLWADYGCHSIENRVPSFVCQQWLCGKHDPLDEEDTRFGKMIVWRPEDDVRCPDGWSRSGSMCFGGITAPTTLDNAKSMCAAQHGALAMINTLEDNDKAFLAAHTLPAFINYGSSFNNFQQGTSITKGCAVMQKTGQWSSDCEQSLPALCQTLACTPRCEPGWVLFKGFCYREESTMRNVVDAEAVCQKEGGHLTSILSQEENDFLFTLLFPHTMTSQMKANGNLMAVFIGAWRPDRTSDWAWRDCAPWKISRWRFVDGNLTSDTMTTCATLQYSGRWLGQPNCDNKYRSVCKKDPCHRVFGPLSSYGCPSDRITTVATTTTQATTTVAPAPAKTEPSVAVSSSGDCPTIGDVQWRNESDVCFSHVGQEIASFEDAFMACRGRLNGNRFGFRLSLPIVSTPERLASLQLTEAKGQDVWLGLSRRWTGYWYWHDRIRVSCCAGHTLQAGDFGGALAGSAEPRCGALDGQTGRVVARDCSDRLPVYCQATPAYYAKQTAPLVTPELRR